METVDCVFCGKTSRASGWAGLCNRDCYHKFCALLEEYDKTNLLDIRVLQYFELYDRSTHLFYCERDPRFSTN
jgi:hypothetical protein